MPGFRRGHVPASIIRQRFSEEIKTDVVEALIPRYFRQEAERLGIHPVSQPRVTDLHLHDGEPLRFKAAFEVLPEIKLEGYKELRADKPEIAVSEAMSSRRSTDLREQHAKFDPIEGPRAGRWRFRPSLARWQLRRLPRRGSGNAAEGQPVHMDEVLVEIAGKNTMPEFTEHLRGANAGDERTFDVNYPEDAQDKRLAGKTFTYTVKVQRHQAEEFARTERGFRQAVRRIHDRR